MRRRDPSAQRRTVMLALTLLACATLTGCGSTGVTYDSLHEGFFGSEPAPTPSQAVAMMFNRDDADQRRKGISWLAASPFGGEEEYLKSYRVFVSDPDPGVRAAVATAIGRHGTVDDAVLLANLVKDDDDLVGWQATDGLRKLHNPAVVPALLGRLDPDIEDDADTRAAAALALGQYPDRIVFARLVTALEQGNFTVVAAAHRSLTLLSGEDVGLDPQAWVAWLEENPNPFARQQPYTYNTYQPNRDWFDRYVTFWNNNDGASDGPETPRGLGDASGG